jgi:hypothetical protein
MCMSSLIILRILGEMILRKRKQEQGEREIQSERESEHFLLL